MKIKKLNDILDYKFHNTLLSYLNIQLIINDKYINNITKRINKDNIIYLIFNNLKGKYIKQVDNNILNELKIIGEKHYMFLPLNNFNTNKDDNLLITNTKYGLGIKGNYNNITMYKYLDKSNQLYNSFNENIFNSTIIDNKYKNITIILLQSASFTYYSIYHYTITYYILYSICFTLKSLKKGGNLLVKLPLFKNNTVLAKLIQFLYTKFEKLNVIYKKEFFYTNQVYLDLRDFKGLSNAEYNLLIKIGNDALKYKINVEDIFNYKYYHDTIECTGNKPGKMYFKFDKVLGLKVEKPENELLVLTDIEDFPVPGEFVNNIIKTIENYYDIYINEYEYNISRLLNEKGEISDNQQFREYKDSLFYPYIENLLKN